jgi:hypothetical protein
MRLPKFEVVPGDDGRVWLCTPVTRDNIDDLISFASDLYQTGCALRNKVKSAEATRFREPLEKVSVR